MVFTDLLFLFAFLPIATIVILIAGEPWEKNAASLICTFVLMLWGRPWYFALVLLPVLATYFVGRLSEKKYYNAVSAITAVSVWAASLALAVLSCRDMSLSGNIWAAAYLLMALKTCFYLGGVKEGEPCEKSFLTLGVYLMSYEFIFMNPCMDYSAVRERIDTRKTKMANMSIGVKSFVVGLFYIAVFGLTFDRIRTVAFLDESLPWANLIVGLLATVAEVYALLCGYMKLSSGLATVNGIYTECDYSGYRYITEVYPDLSKQLKTHFGGKKSSMALLVLSALTAGICIALNIGAGVLVSLVVASLAILYASPDGSGVFEKVFTFLLIAAGFIYAAVSSLEGVLSLAYVNFGTAVSQELIAELSHSVSWAVIGAVALSRLLTQFVATIRMKLTQTAKGYAAYRVLSSVRILLLLLIATVAVVSYS